MRSYVFQAPVRSQALLRTEALLRSSVVCNSHPFRRGDAEKGEPVSQHNLARAREDETRLGDLLRLVQHVRLVIPGVHLAGEIVEVVRDPVRLERRSGVSD